MTLSSIVAIETQVPSKTLYRPLANCWALCSRRPRHFLFVDGGLGKNSVVMFTEFTGYWTLPCLLELWHTRTGNSCSICGVWFECLAYAVQGSPALCILSFRYSLIFLLVYDVMLFLLLQAWKTFCIQHVPRSKPLCSCSGRVPLWGSGVHKILVSVSQRKLRVRQDMRLGKT